MTTKHKLGITTGLLLTAGKVTQTYARITNPVVDSSIGAGDPQEALAIMIANVWKSIVLIGGLGFLIFFAWGALRWMTAEGDKSKFEEGRSKMANGAIGLVILTASVAIIQLLGKLLHIQFLENLIFEFPTP